MQFSYGEATRQSVAETKTVPGKVDYRRIHFVELKAPVDLVVQEVLVKPGIEVTAGMKLAVLTSPELGLARADVEKSESELKIANQALEWSDEIARNLNDLLKRLRDKPRVPAVEEEFEEKLLGDHRQHVIPAYSRYVLAEKNWATGQESFNRGSLSEQKFRQLESALEVAREEYLSVSEQSRFDARQAREKALQAQKYARRLVDVSKRKLSTLLGGYAKVVATGESSGSEGVADGAELTEFFMIAPFEGTIEDRLVADAQRVTEGAVMFRVANTETLEVRAEIREGDWQATSVTEGRTVKVIVTALGEDREFDATVDYVGRALDPETKAVPLVAILDNSQHQFKPGMYARIRIPAGTTVDELAVPSGAVLSHDGKDFVFVPDKSAPRSFHRVDVVVGRRTPEWITITRGLAAGDRVVVEGAFMLKSELLLESEE
jgi:cobalt-zinc-cadmium efflux system membrane fusion protein